MKSLCIKVCGMSKVSFSSIKCWYRFPGSVKSADALAALLEENGKDSVSFLKLFLKSSMKFNCKSNVNF